MHLAFAIGKGLSEQRGIAHRTADFTEEQLGGPAIQHRGLQHRVRHPKPKVGDAGLIRQGKFPEELELVVVFEKPALEIVRHRELEIHLDVGAARLNGQHSLIEIDVIVLHPRVVGLVDTKVGGEGGAHE